MRKISIPFLKSVRAELPSIVEQLELEISNAADVISKLKIELQSKTELAISATKTFDG
jgi:hypothetical protein